MPRLTSSEDASPMLCPHGTSEWPVQCMLATTAWLSPASMEGSVHSLCLMHAAFFKDIPCNLNDVLIKKVAEASAAHLQCASAKLLCIKHSMPSVYLDMPCLLPSKQHLQKHSLFVMKCGSGNLLCLGSLTLHMH